MTAIADTFKALGDPVRLRLFHLLSLKAELCVCHLTEATNLPQSTVSRHLAVLRHAGLVDTRRDGKWIHYRLHDGMALSLAALVTDQADDIQQADAGRLEAAAIDCD